MFCKIYYESDYNLLLLIIYFIFIILRLFILILTNLLSECLSPICSCRRFLSTHFSKKKQGIVINVYVVFLDVFLVFCCTPMLLTHFILNLASVFLSIHLFFKFYIGMKIRMLKLSDF